MSQMNPIDRWSRPMELSIDFEVFDRLPRNVDYRYEYYDDRAHIGPRPRSSDAVLFLSPREAGPEPVDELDPDRATVRTLADSDWEVFPRIFAASLRLVAPFATLDEAERRQAARDCLDWTRSGGDGPLVGAACMVALAGQGHVVGASLVTRPTGPRDGVLPGESIRDQPAPVGGDPRGGLAAPDLDLRGPVLRGSRDRLGPAPRDDDRALGPRRSRTGLDLPQWKRIEPPMALAERIPTPAGTALAPTMEAAETRRRAARPEAGGPRRPAGSARAGRGFGERGGLELR